MSDKTVYIESEEVSALVTRPTYNVLSYDAWGRNKVVLDYSLFHGIFTYSVDRNMFVTYDNGVEQLAGSSRATSVDGAGTFKSGPTIGDTLYVKSRRHPRYQPNKWHLYSSSVFVPNPEQIAERNYGLFNVENGAFFRVRDGKLYAVVRSTTAVGGTVEDEELIDTNVDLSKGNVYDIQMQWRGVGDFTFFINLIPVITFDYLGKLDTLSIANPAIPIGFESKNTSGAECTIRCGCVDISSEGGRAESGQYRAITSSEVALDSTEKALVLFYIPKTFGGRLNTRDCILTQISGYTDTPALMRVYYTRDSSVFTGSTLSSSGSGLQQQALNGDIVASLASSSLFKIKEIRVPANGNVEVTNPDENSPFYLSAGDYILVSMQAKNNTLGGVNIVYSEEI